MNPTDTMDPNNPKSWNSLIVNQDISGPFIPVATKNLALRKFMDFIQRKMCQTIINRKLLDLKRFDF